MAKIRVFSLLADDGLNSVAVASKASVVLYVYAWHAVRDANQETQSLHPLRTVIAVGWQHLGRESRKMGNRKRSR